jgi:Dolichyl-phosphate-mannose-protein mannosyltransferase
MQWLSHRENRTSFLVFLLCFVSAAYFYHLEAGWNVNSRICLTYAIVERGTFEIDYYQRFQQLKTSDITFYKGHYYSDKIIGTSLLGTIPMLAVSAIERLSGHKFSWNAKRYAVELFTVRLLGALSAIVLFRILLILGATTEAALFLTISYFFGTQVFSVSMIFVSYAPVLFFTLLSYLTLLRYRENLSVRVLSIAGFFAGAAMLCEYTATIANFGLFLYALFHSKRRLSSIAFLLSAALPLSLFLLYTINVLGRPAIPYYYEANESFRVGMSQGFLGIKTFNPTVLYLLTFGGYRGLFYHSPFLLLAIAGWVAMWRYLPRRSDLLLSIMIVISYLLFNASYYLWWGGFTNGPRHLILSIPFLIFPLVSLWNFSKAGRTLIVAAAAFAILFNTLPAMVDAQLPQGYSSTFLFKPEIKFPYMDPLWEFGIKKLTHKIAVNPGIFLGLKGVWSSLPLALFWVVVSWMLMQTVRTDQTLKREVTHTRQD